jgi:hypothetical protein
MAVAIDTGLAVLMVIYALALLLQRSACSSLDHQTTQLTNSFETSREGDRA